MTDVLDSPVTTWPEGPTAGGPPAWRPRGRVASLWRGREDDPAWVRPALLALLVGTAVLYLWGLGSVGWGNSYYTAAVQAGSKSWKAFLYGSTDASNFVTVDKTPASLWPAEIAVRIFGLNSWSVLAPQALEGVAAVGVLYLAIRRWFGPAAGLVAGLVLALTPVAALMFRYNNPDALLMLCLVLAAYWLTRAIEDGRTRWVVLTGAALGVGFLAKELQAFLVIPGFALAYLVAAPGSILSRIRKGAVMAVSMVVAAGWWIAIVVLVPAASRPYIGGSQNNSFWNVLFGYNGFGRLTGNETGSVGAGPGGPGAWGATGWSRMFDAQFGFEASWLLPAALLLLVVGLAVTLTRRRTDRTRAALVIWGGWLVTTAVAFSFGKGIIHEYYAVALAPAIGGVIGVGTRLLWTHRSTVWGRVALVGTLAVTVWWLVVLLDRVPQWHPGWAGVLIGLALALAVAARLCRPTRSRGRGRRGRRAGARARGAGGGDGDDGPDVTRRPVADVGSRTRRDAGRSGRARWPGWLRRTAPRWRRGPRWVRRCPRRRSAGLPRWWLRGRGAAGCPRRRPRRRRRERARGRLLLARAGRGRDRPPPHRPERRRALGRGIGRRDQRRRVPDRLRGTDHGDRRLQRLGSDTDPGAVPAVRARRGRPLLHRFELRRAGRRTVRDRHHDLAVGPGQLHVPYGEWRDDLRPQLRSHGRMSGERILLVDDEDNLRTMLAAALAHSRFEVETAADGREALAKVPRFLPDLILLDVMMPDLDGFEVCRRLRTSAVKTPVVFLTARDDTEDTVRGLTIGGDDYLVKPFSLEELVARIDAVLRRTRPQLASVVVRCADLELDEDAHRVTRAGVEIALSPTEFNLLRFMLANQGRVLSRAQILDHVWDYDFDGDGRIVETYVAYLRKKLDPHGPRLIQTVRGIGYCLREA